MISIRVVVPNFRNHSFVESYKIKEFPLYKQPDEITCGPATVYMVLRFYKLNIACLNCCCANTGNKKLVC